MGVNPSPTGFLCVLRASVVKRNLRFHPRAGARRPANAEYFRFIGFFFIDSKATV